MTHLISKVKILTTANLNYNVFDVAVLKMTPKLFDVLPIEM